ARRARAFDMRLVAVDVVSAPDDGGLLDWFGHPDERLDDLLRESDLVSLHVPLNAGTRNLLDARRLALMKESAILVNVARGELVDESALVAALRAGRLAGAGTDVLVREPIGAD